MKRIKSKRIFRNCKRTMSEYLEAEPTAEVVGEQPRRAQSWSQTSWKDIKKSLYFSKFDGCEFDMRNSEGSLIQKSWAVATTSRPLHLLLDGRLCSHAKGSRPVIQGEETAKSALYPTKLCKLIVKIILGKVSERATFLMELLLKHQDDDSTIEDACDNLRTIFAEDFSALKTCNESKCISEESMPILDILRINVWPRC